MRHVIADVLWRNEVHDPELEAISITVSEVRISPDLKNASVFVTPLAGSSNGNKAVDRLNALSHALRKEVGKRTVLKYSPKLYFKLDTSFDAAGRVLALLNSEEVLRDVSREKADDEQ